MQFNWYYIEKLLACCSLPAEEQDRIVDRLRVIEQSEDEFCEMEFWLIHERLVDNQFDPITAGHNYGQTDIIKHLSKLR